MVLFTVPEMTAPELSEFSPDEYALLLVQQYLSENGHSEGEISKLSMWSMP